MDRQLAIAHVHTAGLSERPVLKNGVQIYISLDCLALDCVRPAKVRALMAAQKIQQTTALFLRRDRPRLVASALALCAL
jgi:hypothetical protein